MAKPLITIIRESLKARLLAAENLAPIICGRVFLNRFDALAQAELTAIGLYILGEEPIDNNLSPSPDERKIDLAIELWSPEDEEMEGRLDFMAAEVEKLLTLDDLGQIIEKQGGPDTLLKISWRGNQRLYISETETGLGLNLMIFELEYCLPNYGEHL